MLGPQQSFHYKMPRSEELICRLYIDCYFTYIFLLHAKDDHTRIHKHQYACQRDLELHHVLHQTIYIYISIVLCNQGLYFPKQNISLCIEVHGNINNKQYIDASWRYSLETSSRPADLEHLP